VRKAFKYRLYPNRSQTEATQAMLETHRRLYNSALEERRNLYGAERLGRALVCWTFVQRFCVEYWLVGVLGVLQPSRTKVQPCSARAASIAAICSGLGGPAGGGKVIASAGRLNARK
jgi:hypothetical protein